MLANWIFFFFRYGFFRLVLLSMLAFLLFFWMMAKLNFLLYTRAYYKLRFPLSLGLLLSPDSSFSSFLAILFVSRFGSHLFPSSCLISSMHYPCLCIQSCLLLHTYIPFLFPFYHLMPFFFSLALVLALKHGLHPYIISTISFPFSPPVYHRLCVFLFLFFPLQPLLTPFFCLFVECEKHPAFM